MALLARDVLRAREIVGARPGVRSARIGAVDAKAAQWRNSRPPCSRVLALARARRLAASGDTSSIE
jgi:hypothetical protein